MAHSTLPANFIEQAVPFLRELVQWERELPTLAWGDFVVEAQKGQVALFSIDMINGFCHEGALASPRIRGIIPAVVAAMKGAFGIGVRNFVLAQDCHTENATEFADFPPHCQAGSREAEIIPELLDLPALALATVVHKNSLHAFHGTNLDTWLDEHSDMSIATIVGDCTDLCVYQTALHLKLHANAYNKPLRVIVPENAVQTYDTPVEITQEAGILPHNGDVMHLLALYHMRLNGIEVVREIR
ncbi:cysteine hydrolase family protein [Ktedonospora formicarum]|uniref:Nicotinamidase n=1 Tax=Ktedonospora formicarum TaxID=2778364 RepID=A0A8J3HWD3_9CHLR|nr:isochorismatase family cysteine hydrolase [Ktedonospora formicarum]GHO44984.1 nicotinamidase [Ktedonospora formicarum]